MTCSKLAVLNKAIQGTFFEKKINKKGSIFACDLEKVFWVALFATTILNI